MAPSKSKSKKGKSAMSEREGMVFPNVEYEERYFDLFEKRKVCAGREIDMFMLECINFSYLPYIEEFGWKKLLKLSGNCYERIVKQFYSNLSTDDEGIKTFIGGVEINFSTANIREYLRIPEGGKCLDTNVVFNQAFILRMSRSIFKNPDLMSPSFKITGLGMHERILHLLIAYNVNSRGAGYSSMTYEDMWFLFMVMRGHQIDLARWISDNILAVYRRSKHMLQYGLLISNFIRLYYPDLVAEETYSTQSVNARFSYPSLKKMGYKEVNGNWVKRTGESEQMETDEGAAADEEAELGDRPTANRPASPDIGNVPHEEPMVFMPCPGMTGTPRPHADHEPHSPPPARTPAPAPAGPSVDQAAILDAISNLKMYMESSNENVNARLDQMNSRIDSVQQNVSNKLTTLTHAQMAHNRQLLTLGNRMTAYFRSRSELQSDSESDHDSLSDDHVH